MSYILYDKPPVYLTNLPADVYGECSGVYSSQLYFDIPKSELKSYL